VVSATGELGVVSSSSRRFKMAIESMESNTAKLAQLRPVMFRFKTDPLGMLLLHFFQQDGRELIVPHTVDSSLRVSNSKFRVNFGHILSNEPPIAASGVTRNHPEERVGRVALRRRILW
jgi:hypothetical protein